MLGLELSERNTLTGKDVNNRIGELERELRRLKDFAIGFPGSSCAWEQSKFIRTTFFEEYVKAIIDKEIPDWVADNVNLEDAAFDLRAEYMVVELDEVEYLVKK